MPYIVPHSRLKGWVCVLRTAAAPYPAVAWRGRWAGWTAPFGAPPPAWRSAAARAGGTRPHLPGGGQRGRSSKHKVLTICSSAGNAPHSCCCGCLTSPRDHELLANGGRQPLAACSHQPELIQAPSKALPNPLPRRLGGLPGHQSAGSAAMEAAQSLNEALAAQRSVWAAVSCDTLNCVTQRVAFAVP